MEPIYPRSLRKKIERNIPEINVSAAQALLVTNTLFIDIREIDEVVDGVIPGAHHVSRGDLESWLEKNVNVIDEQIVLYCEAGKRSVFAANALLSLGYKNVSSLKGGVRSWIEFGLDLDVDSGLDAACLKRYSRQIILPEVGLNGQKKLAASKVLVVGAGGLGSPCLYYLAAAGVGTIGIADHDVVEESNLHRQILFDQNSLGMQKAEAAEQKIKGLNSNVKTNIYLDAITRDNLAAIVSLYDILVDCTDNFSARYALNDAAVAANIPIVHGAIHKFQGVLGVFNLPGGPCYRCIYPEPPPKELSPACSEAGVLGVIPGVVGLLQATEAIKLILFSDAHRDHKLLRYNGLNASLTSVEISLRLNCICRINKD